MPDHPGPDGKTYHEYSPEEREQLAHARLMRIITAHAQVDAMSTFLCFTWGQVPAAVNSGDRARIIEALTNIKNDVNDVASAANQLVTTYAATLDEIAKEYFDTDDYLAWKAANTHVAEPQD